MNRHWRASFPFLISAGLIGWLVWSVSPHELLSAASKLNWRFLAPATTLMVVGLYLWDAVCVRTLFAVGQHNLTYRQALHARGLSYLAGVLNYEMGQAVLAWGIARMQATSVLSALSRSVLLAYHDVVVLLGLGFLGSVLTDDSRVDQTGTACMIGLVVLLVLAGAVVFLLPASARQRVQQTRWGAWVETWSWGRTAKLAMLRVVYFSILIAYGAVALGICHLHVDHTVVLSTIPLVMLADALPSISGLGTRDAALKFLLRPQRPEVLLAMSLFWSTGLIVGRLTIGLGHLWLQRLLALSFSSPGESAEENP